MDYSTLPTLNNNNLIVPNIENVNKNINTIEEFNTQMYKFHSYEKDLGIWINIIDWNLVETVGTEIEIIKTVAENISNVENLAKYNLMVNEFKIINLDSSLTKENRIDNIEAFIIKIKELIND